MTIFNRIAALLLLGVALLASGLLLEEALKMYRDDTLRSHPEAITALKDAARQGNTDAAFLLATAYKDGKTGTKDTRSAVAWYTRAANLGDADAMLMLGWMFYKGDAANKPDVAAAKMWFEKAAARGVDEAVEMLDILNES